MTDRALFLAHVYQSPTRGAQASVVLCGEDALVRVETAFELCRLHASEQVILSGGRHEPPAILGADAMRGHLIGLGLQPARILTEAQSQNTREQFVNVRAMMPDLQQAHIVASAYHLPRALLTAIAVAPEVRWIPVAARGPWHQCPPGTDRTRAELFHVEGVKITEYQGLGHAVSYAEGIDYLKRGEGK